MLRVQQLSVNGRRDELLPATSLQVRRGELLLVSDKRQAQRTALALALTGRLRPSAGHFEWDGAEWDRSARIKTLRQASAVVDSPGVNEPEQHLSVRDLVTEDLALIPRRYRGSLLSKPWLKVNRFEDIAGLWTEQLPAARRLELLTALALTNPHTDLLVVDSPDRHGDPDDWLPRLEELAYDAGRPLAVVATVLSVPAGWTGPTSAVGNAGSAARGDRPDQQLEVSTTPETEDAK
ncbi:MAG TPA: ABC transporter ATP-binding protein [Arthrobacter sp.]